MRLILSTDRRSLLPWLLLAWVLPAHSMSISGGLELAWRDYDARETSAGGSVLNREQGDLLGVAMRVAIAGPAGRWTMHAAHAGGDVGYRGITQLLVPLRTTTRLEVNSGAVSWSPPADPVIAGVAIRPWVQLTRQRIDRAILPSPISTALTEKLDATFAQAGLALRLPLVGRLSMEAAGLLSRPLRQRLKVDTFGSLDRFVLRPTARTSGRVDLGVVWQPAADLRAELQVSREYWRFGMSGLRDISRDGEVVGTAYYPGSRQLLNGISLRIDYQLRANNPPR